MAIDLHTHSTASDGTEPPAVVVDLRRHVIEVRRKILESQQTAVMDGVAIRSCVTPVAAAQNKAVTTLEGLGNPKKLHKIQQAFVDEQAVQCGYCINGMIMTTKALLDKNPKPTDSQIKDALAGNLCRCGTHLRIVRAVKRASGQLA